jgi:tryptophanyl-tRNA synthetase
MSLRDPHAKMSKSHNDPRSRIMLTDGPEDVISKVGGALTDSEAGITYEPKRRPGVANLLELLAHFEDTRPELLVDRYHNSSLRAIKEAVAETLIKALQPIRSKYELIMASGARDRLRDISSEGARKAQDNSQNILNKVRDAVGY